MDIIYTVTAVSSLYFLLQDIQQKKKIKKAQLWLFCIKSALYCTSLQSKLSQETTIILVNLTQFIIISLRSGPCELLTINQFKALIELH